MSPSVRRLLALVLAVLLAIVGTVSVVSYAQRADERALAGQAPIEVLVVATAIPLGTPAADASDSVRTALLPSTAVADGAVTDLAELEGLVAAVDLVPGEQVLRERFVAPEALEAPVVVPVPEGLQEISFLLPMDRVVGGRIGPGDRVGVYATFDRLTPGEEPESGPIIADTVSALLLDELLVTFVQYSEVQPVVEVEGGPLVPKGDLLLTFAVDTLTAERLTFAFDQGRVRLTRLNDATVQAPRSLTSKDNVFG